MDHSVAEPSPTSSDAAAPRRERASGVILPKPLRWHQRLAALLIYALVRTINATLRSTVEIHPRVLDPQSGPFIFCIWHNRLPLCLIGYRVLARRRGQPVRMAAIVSASRDGSMVARVLEYFGIQPVRGSTSRRGPQALLELTTWAERGYDLALTPDGPRGPCYVVQPGAIALAQVTGLVVVPASYELSWKIRAKTWDRFQIPLPFSRFHLRIGEPVVVARDASEEQRESLRAELERRMRALTVD